MASELASAYLTLMPSLKGAHESIEQQLSGVDASSAGRGIGSSLVGGVTEKVASFTNTAVTLFGSIGGALGSMAASGGMTRALNLEQAQHMFKGLKLDWADYKDTITEAVDGTAFSLDAAALVAANLAASGVGAGEQMEKALHGVTGAAATFGSDLGDIGGIFQKVAAQGKLTGDNLFQLSSRGINAVSVLADHLGKTQEEVSQMVSSGKIDFQTFSDAMYEAFGDSAQAANETFTGSMSNMRSALNRIGEKFATPFKDALIPVFNATRLALNQVNKAITPVADQFGKFAGIVSEQLVSKLEAFTAAMEKGGSLLDGFRAALGPVGGTVAALAGGVVALGAGFGALSSVVGVIPGLSTFVGMLSGGAGASALFRGALTALTGPVGAVIALVGALAAATVYLWNTDEDFRAQMTDIASQLSSSLAPILDQISASLQDMASTVLPLLMQAAGSLMPVVASLIETIAGVLAEIIPAVAELAAAVIPLVTEIMEVVITAATAILETVLPIVEEIVQFVGEQATALVELVTPIVEDITALIAQHMPEIQAIIDVAMQFIQTLFQTVWPVVQGIVENVMGVITNVISTLWPQISNLISAAMTFISGLIQTYWPYIQGVITSAMGVIESVVNTVWPFIETVISSAMSVIQSVISIGTAVISGDWSAVWSGVASLVSSIWEGVKNTVRSGVEMVANLIRELPGKILGFFSNAGTMLLQAGRDIINGLIDGIKSGISALGDTLGNIGQFIADNKGPRDYDLKLLVPNGGWIMESLSRGMEKGIPGLRSTLDEVSDEIGGYEFGVSANYRAAMASGESANDASAALLSEMLAEIAELREGLGRTIAENAPVVTETERQASRRIRRAVHA